MGNKKRIIGQALVLSSIAVGCLWRRDATNLSIIIGGLQPSPLTHAHYSHGSSCLNPVLVVLGGIKTPKPLNFKGP
jgi:hypothetical protein